MMPFYHLLHCRKLNTLALLFLCNISSAKLYFSFGIGTTYFFAKLAYYFVIKIIILFCEVTMKYKQVTCNNVALLLCCVAFYAVIVNPCPCQFHALNTSSRAICHTSKTENCIEIYYYKVSKMYREYTQRCIILFTPKNIYIETERVKRYVFTLHTSCMPPPSTSELIIDTLRYLYL